MNISSKYRVTISPVTSDIIKYVDGMISRLQDRGKIVKKSQTTQTITITWTDNIMYLSDDVLLNNGCCIRPMNNANQTVEHKFTYCKLCKFCDTDVTTNKTTHGDMNIVDICNKFNMCVESSSDGCTFGLEEDKDVKRICT